MAAGDEMVDIAISIKPDAVSLVPENPAEVTTEGGLDVIGNFDAVSAAARKLKEAGIFVSIFIDPETDQIEAAKRAGAQQVELCTAEYAELTLGGGAVHGSTRAHAAIDRIRNAARHGRQIGLIVAAGHGLTYRNIAPLAAMPEITEFNIGHNIISRALMVGLETAVREMITAIRDARP
jgi:pyridoxine 5-phosphate synthase